MIRGRRFCEDRGVCVPVAPPEYMLASCERVEGRGCQKFDDKLYEEVVVFVSKLMPLNKNNQDVFLKSTVVVRGGIVQAAQETAEMC